MSEGLLKNETILDFAKNLRKDQIKRDLTSYIDSSLTDSIIEKNTQKLIELINNTKISAEFKHHSNEIIQKGAEMFLYLNPYIRGSVLNYWTEFYSDFFSLGTSSQQKVLSLFKILNNAKSKDSKEIANKILVQLSRELGFKNNRPDVLKDGILNQIIWRNNIENITGRLILLNASVKENTSIQKEIFLHCS